MFHERGAYYPARHTARQSRNQKAGKHIRAGITPEDNVFARRATNLTISSTESASANEQGRPQGRPCFWCAEQGRKSSCCRRGSGLRIRWLYPVAELSKLVDHSPSACLP